MPSGSPIDGQPAVDVADDRDARGVEVEQLHRDHPEDHGDQRAGHRRARTARRPSTTASETQRRRASVRHCVSPRLVRKPHSCSKKLPSLLLDAEQLRDLADDDRQRQADDEALQHRLGDEAGEEPEPEQPGHEGEDPGDEREHAVKAAKSSGPPRDEVGDRRGGQRGRGRHRPDDEMPGAAERGVEDQRRGRGVEPDDRRDTGDGRVGERLGHEHRPDGQAGDEIAAQPPAVVAR